MVARKKTRQREAQLGFEALSIEGGLLSPDWLSCVAQRAAGSQSEADYRIPKGLNLRDEIGRYWRIAQAHWSEFAAGRASNVDARVLAERIVQALLKDSFGFATLSPAPAVVIAERTHPIGFSALGRRVPVVIAPAGSGLDTLASGCGDGSRRRSAFGLAQEFLNAADGAMWGLASDGVTLRILRDNASLTRPAWIEADLGRIFTEERYADFAALWLLAHETRFGRPDQPVTECALEIWRNAGREEGTRAREHLRRGVEEALVALGQGFLAHPDNQMLRAALQDGSLTTKEYFNQLLRLVYRLIFLLTVEERGLLHPDGAFDQAKLLYAEGYSMRRLRDRSVKRSAHDRFSDLWEAAKIVFRGLASGEPRLALPALTGIFAKTQCPALDTTKLENRTLLLAVFRLSWLREDTGISRVNWRDMGPEELGSVYESLLELVPQITKDGRQFAFATGGETRGNARKTTGSYYTPDSLVKALLDSALEPVIADTIAKNPDKPVEALLNLSIVDPACGSGHFLLAAARRLAEHVARLQANGTPSTAEYRHALRQVVGRCIYGVDLNPMAVELCKVSLWMEALEPGKPLSFLDAHIRRGNSLLGATPALVEGGVPDEAFEPIEGDDKAVARKLKKRNKDERKRSEVGAVQLTLDEAFERLTRDLAATAVKIEAASDDSFGELRQKEDAFQAHVASEAYGWAKRVADAWCAAFVQRKVRGEPAVTHETMRQLREDPASFPEELRSEIARLADDYAFFHWHVEFPDVFRLPPPEGDSPENAQTGWSGGFDVMLGNPPWERVKLQEKEFFAKRCPDIADAKNKAARQRMIAALEDEDPVLHREFRDALRQAEAESHVLRRSRRYPLCGRGDVNTYAVFAEAMRAIIGSAGRVGCIVPTGIATDDTTKGFFTDLVDRRSLGSLFDFENAVGLFPGVHRSYKFCLLTLTGQDRPASEAEFAFFAHRTSDLADPDRRFTLAPQDFALLNPNTRTCPVFRSRRDAEITKEIYRRIPVLIDESKGEAGNPWQVTFSTMFHMSNDSGLFRSAEQLRAEGFELDGNVFHRGRETYLPLYEAKMVHQFNHRFGDYAMRPQRSLDTELPRIAAERLAESDYAPLPRYWVPAREVAARIAGKWDRNWLLGWRDITNATNERTVIAAVIPRAGVGHNMPLALPDASSPDLACLLAGLNALALDYVARQKIGGTHLTFFILNQLPVLPSSVYDAPAPWCPDSRLAGWLVPRVLELSYTARDLKPFARDLGYDGPPFRWDPERRSLLRAELDAAFFHLYGISREDADYILDTFPIVKRKDEVRHGEYRTKRVILEIYDAMADAARTGKPYHTHLDPPPADPQVAHAPKSRPEASVVPKREGALSATGRSR